MKPRLDSRKAQSSFETGIVMLYILILIIALWMGGPLQQTTEKNTDTNDILLGAKMVDTIASAVKCAGMSGVGERRDFVVHVPWNTVDINYYLEDGEPYINLSVVLYGEVEGAEEYWVDADQQPWWDGGKVAQTGVYYITVKKQLDFPLDEDYEELFFCQDEPRKAASDVRGAGTIFVDENGNDITFCCEAGFNLHMYAEPSRAHAGKVVIRPRYYYSLPDNWHLY